MDARHSDPLDSAALAMLRAEETIALVARATPKNGDAEAGRLTALAGRRGALRPAFVYDGRPNLSDLQRGLERLARELSSQGRLGALSAARAEELELEARMVGEIGGPGFSRLSAERFPRPGAALEARVAAFVATALGAAPSASLSGDATYSSDDHDSSPSLVSQLRRRARELGISVRFEIRPGQLAVAATGHGIVGIRPGVPLSAEAAARIALHELLAHALPRARSVYAPFALLRAGTHGSVEGEEGRALLVEQRAGYLDAARRRELALRHVGALAVRRGADFEETVRELVSKGADAPYAIQIAVRVHRGGGLAREIVYLPAYEEVALAFAGEPGLERWFERGRVGLEAARELSALGDAAGARSRHSSNSMNTGA